ncbi:TPA: HNH endonuclease signature motif containing protein [Aeromonas hydrophila]|uniref:HNH endonuclease signature motif containing protein n=1 Tax=Aeromonas hydrophila TaxID=644 RepID=UPI003D1F23DD
MAFKAKIADMLAYRSAYICNNPECNTLTVGAALNDSNLKLKLGEAAHIIGEKPKSARYENIGQDELSSIDNGIWLCANCHTMIDKIDGMEFKKEELYSWKEKHEKMISMLLKTHKSPVPLLVRQTENFDLAQSLVDFLSGKGAFYEPASFEHPTHVILSLTETRKFLNRETRKIQLDPNLKQVFSSINKCVQEVMNETSQSAQNLDLGALDDYLTVMRRKVGKQLKILQEKYGCSITGKITTIL